MKVYTQRRRCPSRVGGIRFEGGEYRTSDPKVQELIETSASFRGGLIGVTEKPDPNTVTITMETPAPVVPVAAAPAAPETPAAVAPARKFLSQLTKAEMIEFAKGQGIEFDGKSRADLYKAIKGLVR